VATQNIDIVSEKAMENLRQEFEGTSFGDHVGAVMDAATDDIKSVVLPVTDAIGEAVHSTTRDVAFFIAGGVFTLVVIAVSRFI
jgi:hypothetical protein